MPMKQGQLNTLKQWHGLKAQAAASATERRAVIAGGTGDVDMVRFLSPQLKGMALVQESGGASTVGALVYHQPHEYASRFGRYFEEGMPLVVKSGSGASGYGQRVVAGSPEPYQSQGKDWKGGPDPRWPAGGVSRIDDGTGNYYVGEVLATGVPVRAQPSGLYQPSDGGYIQVRYKRWYRAPFSDPNNPYYFYEVALEWREGSDYITKAGERYDDDASQVGSKSGTPILNWVFKNAATGVIRQNPYNGSAVNWVNHWVGLENYVP